MDIICQGAVCFAVLGFILEVTFVRLAGADYIHFGSGRKRFGLWNGGPCGRLLDIEFIVGAASWR